jgi:hypothetical protein
MKVSLCMIQRRGEWLLSRTVLKLDLSDGVNKKVIVILFREFREFKKKKKYIPLFKTSELVLMCESSKGLVLEVIEGAIDMGIDELIGYIENRMSKVFSFF